MDGRDMLKMSERTYLPVRKFRACRITNGGRGWKGFRIDTHTRHVAHYRTFIQRIVSLGIRFRYDTRYLHNT